MAKKKKPTLKKKHASKKHISKKVSKKHTSKKKLKPSYSPKPKRSRAAGTMLAEAVSSPDPMTSSPTS